MEKRALTLGLAEARGLVLKSIRPLPAEEVSLAASTGRVAARDLYALVDSPSSDVSRKDGYAVLSGEVARATDENPVRLRLTGLTAAGAAQGVEAGPGETVRVLTGARVPEGADAVIAEEYTRRDGPDVLIGDPTGCAINILRRGGDVAKGSYILRSGCRILPSTAGLLAAAGYRTVPVFKNPVAGIIGTGDELVEPGMPLKDGDLYASNIITLAGWCRKYSMRHRMKIVRDDHDAILAAVRELSGETDALITSGGAWMGDRDMVAGVLEDLGWQMIFHRIRMGPGKAVGFGTLNGKPVFILPGGPPSNLMGFLQIALPGLLALCGDENPGLPQIHARLAADINEGDDGWTDLFFGTLEADEGLPLFRPMIKRSRLSLIANATAIAAIPEGSDRLPGGSLIRVQLLT